MATWFSNTIRAEGIGSLPLYGTEKDGERCFDFNTVIPMPESLHVEYGSVTGKAILYYLTERLTKTDSDVAEKYAKARGLTSCFDAQGYLEHDLGLTKEYIFTWKPDPDNLYSMGRQYVENFEVYGYSTGIEWAYDRWGTKWNACDTVAEEDEVSFETANGGAGPVAAALSAMYPGKTFVHECISEDSDTMVVSTYRGGKKTGEGFVYCGPGD